MGRYRESSMPWLQPPNLQYVHRVLERPLSLELVNGPMENIDVHVHLRPRDPDQAGVRPGRSAVDLAGELPERVRLPGAAWEVRNLPPEAGVPQARFRENVILSEA